MLDIAGFDDISIAADYKQKQHLREAAQSRLLKEARTRSIPWKLKTSVAWNPNLVIQISFSRA